MKSLHLRQGARDDAIKKQRRKQASSITHFSYACCVTIILASTNHKTSSQGNGESKIFIVSEYTFGYVRDLSHGNRLDIRLGTQFTINNRPDALDRYYGDDLGYVFQFFLRIHPSLHSHSGHDHSMHAVAEMEK